MKFKLTFLFATLLLSASFISSTSTETIEINTNLPDKWHKFTSENGNVSISFPAEYEKGEEAQEGIITHKVSSVVGNTTYFFGYTIHESPLDAPKELAEASLEGFNGAIGGTILSKGPYKYKKNEGMEAKITIEDKAYVLYKVVMVGQVQCQLVIIDVEDKFGKDAEKFFNSFSAK